MKLNAIAFANAATLLMVGFYLICVLVSVLWPSLLWSVAQSWVHSLDLSKLMGGTVTLSSLTLGLVSLAVLTWIADYLFAVVYNLLVGE